MTVPQAIELFKNEMINEVFNCVPNSSLQDVILKSIDDVTKTVIITYEAEKNQK